MGQDGGLLQADQLLCLQDGVRLEWWSEHTFLWMLLAFPGWEEWVGWMEFSGMLGHCRRFTMLCLVHW